MNTNNLVVLLVIAISIVMVPTWSAAQPQPEQCSKVNERCFSDNECCDGYNCGLETIKVDYSICQNCNTRGHACGWFRASCCLQYYCTNFVAGTCESLN